MLIFQTADAEEFLLAVPLVAQRGAVRAKTKDGDGESRCFIFLSSVGSLLIPTLDGIADVVITEAGTDMSLIRTCSLAGLPGYRCFSPSPAELKTQG